VATVRYRTYDANLAKNSPQVLADADEYYQDLANTIEGIAEPKIFLTAWAFEPRVMVTPTQRFEDVIVTALKKTNATCYFLLNPQVPGLTPTKVNRQVKEFRDRVAKQLPAGTVDSKLKIILSANLEYDVNWLLDIFIFIKGLLAPQQPNSVLGWLERLWLVTFPTYDGEIRNLEAFTVATYHEKTVIIAGAKAGQPPLTAYCGGIDFWPGPAGAGSPNMIHMGGWAQHDFALRLRGDAAFPILENFVDRWNDEIDRYGEIVQFGVAEDDELDEDDFYVETGEANVDDVVTERTVPDGANDILDRYEDLIDDAERFIFIENQYIRHRGLAQRLINALDREPNLKVTIIMPLYPEELAKAGALPTLRQSFAAATTQAQRDALMARVREATNTVDPVNKLALKLQTSFLKDLVGHPRVKVWMPCVVRGSGATLKVVGLPYVHSKIMVVDDRALTVGSANLNGRSLDATTDSELNVTFIREPDASASIDVDRIIKDSRFNWRQDVLDHGVDSETSPTYPNSYFGKRRMIRYRQAHWQVDLEYSKFPIGKANIVSYFDKYRKSAYYDSATMATPQDFADFLDSIPDGIFDVEQDDLGELLLGFMEDLL
jgi:phosphatidylserine/phosphatidylglycerophosphate/cardiolipin synthase-like enzyme